MRNYYFSMTKTGILGVFRGKVGTKNWIAITRNLIRAADIKHRC